MLPALVVHADWSAGPSKRWMARACLDGGGCRAHPPEPVGDPRTLVDRLRAGGDSRAAIVIGFDFPIGLPAAYARRARIGDYLAVLPRFGHGQWSDFYTVARRPGEISLRRPFYPAGAGRPNRARHEHLRRALGVAAMGDLRRRCDHGRPGRRPAAPLFWTLGPQQVGKAAICGWREVLVPGLREGRGAVAVWPFDGPLHELSRPGRVVFAETYPAECYGHLGVVFPPPSTGARSGKQVQRDRAANAGALLDWARDTQVRLDAPLARALRDGFGDAPGGEDRFDATVGLFGMLNVVLGRRPEGAPDHDLVRTIEGWVVGLSPDP